VNADTCIECDGREVVPCTDVERDCDIDVPCPACVPTIPGLIGDTVCCMCAAVLAHGDPRGLLSHGLCPPCGRRLMEEDAPHVAAFAEDRDAL
jgi:hypothetical protein